MPVLEPSSPELVLLLELALELTLLALVLELVLALELVLVLALELEVEPVLVSGLHDTTSVPQSPLSKPKAAQL
jgi:hypothetical protein